MIKTRILNDIIKDIKSIFKVQDKAKLVKQNLPYLAFFYIGNIFTNHLRSYKGGDVIDKTFQAILELKRISYLPSLHLMDLAFGVLFVVLVKFIVYTKGKNTKKFRQGKEYGSARWVA